MKREELGLNDPLLVRYFNYMKNLLRGDMGTSYKNNIPVWNQVIDRLPNTAILAVAGIFIALLFGIPIGILSAKKQYSLLDNISMVAALIGVSMPNFWSGLLLVMLFSLTLGWLPSQGMGSGGVIPVLRSIILPSLTLGINSMAMVARMTRSSMLEVIRQDYISTAQAKGLNDHVITTLELANTLTVNLFGIINEHYIQNLSWETAKGKHQAAKEGYFIGSRVPFGYRKWKLGDSPEIDKRMLIVDEKEAAALRHCFEMYSTGSCSFSNLADYLNESGFVSRSGRAFRDDTLRSMLENPIYIGIIEYQGTKKETYLTYKGKHQP